MIGDLEKPSSANETNDQGKLDQQLSTEVSAATSLELAVAYFVRSKGSKNIFLQREFFRALIAHDEAQLRVIITTTLEALVNAFSTQKMPPKVLNRKLHTLLLLDGHFDQNEGREYLVIKSYLEALLESEDEIQQALGNAFIASISVNTMEYKLERMDQEYCSPQRLAEYINSATYFADRAFRTKTIRAEQRHRWEGEADPRIEARLVITDELVGLALERGEVELGFLEAVIFELTAKERYLTIMKTILRLAQAGYEQSHIFIEDFPESNLADLPINLQTAIRYYRNQDEEVVSNQL